MDFKLGYVLFFLQVTAFDIAGNKVIQNILQDLKKLGEITHRCAPQNLFLWSSISKTSQLSSLHTCICRLFQSRYFSTKIWVDVQENMWKYADFCLYSYTVEQLVVGKAKGWISKRCTRTCVYDGVRNVSFSKNMACFVFL